MAAILPGSILHSNPDFKKDGERDGADVPPLGPPDGGLGVHVDIHASALGSSRFMTTQTWTKAERIIIHDISVLPEFMSA